jgi:hypothetical protein
MRVAYKAAASVGSPEIIKAGELVEASFAHGLSPSTSARRIMALMIEQAAGDAWEENREFKIPKKTLRGSHKGSERLRDVLDEIQRTLLRIRWSFVSDVTGQADRRVRTVSLLSYRDEDEGGEYVRYTFHPVVSYVMRRSNKYAGMNRAILLSFESRYAITLYELGSMRVGLSSNAFWEGTVEELRALLGVTPGQYEDWANLRRRTIDQAAEEINQLAGFVVTTEVTQKVGRRIARVRISFTKKSDEERSAAVRELKASRLGRRARRKNMTERIVDVGPRLSPELRRDLDRLRAGLPPLRYDEFLQGESNGK